MSSTVLVLASRLAVTAIATFLAIAVWSGTRDAAWMLIVIGIIAGYADILFSLLVEFGLAPQKLPLLGDFPLLAIIFSTIPWLFFSAAFIIMIRKKSGR